MHQIIACFFTDWYFNRLYLYSKERANAKGLTITDCYRDMVLSFTNEIQKQEDSFRTMVNNMFNYFRENTSQKTASFKQFTDDLLISFVPQKHFVCLNEEQKDFFLNQILKEIVSGFAEYAIQFEQIKQVIDKRKEKTSAGYVTKEWIRAFVAEQGIIRDRIWSQFARETKGKDGFQNTISEELYKEMERKYVALEVEHNKVLKIVRATQARGAGAEEQLDKLKHEKQSMWEKIKGLVATKCALEEQIENMNEKSVADMREAQSIIGELRNQLIMAQKELSLIKNAQAAAPSNYERSSSSYSRPIEVTAPSNYERSSSSYSRPIKVEEVVVADAYDEPPPEFEKPSTPVENDIEAMFNSTSEEIDVSKDNIGKSMLFDDLMSNVGGD